MTWIERFWSKVDKTAECWLWTGPTASNGYAQVSVGGRFRLVHRVAWELAGNELIAGLTIDHLCRTRTCVRVSHMEQVTRRENIMRGFGMGVRNAAKTHCPKGHPYNFVQPNGDRRCRVCHNETMRRYRARRAA